MERGARAASCHTEVPRREAREYEKDEERSAKSSAAYVGFRARLAATAAMAAAAAALIRVRRYEIIKLGLDGGEGDGTVREKGRRKGGKTGGTAVLDVGGDGTLEGAQRRGEGTQGDNRIPYTGI